MNKRPDIQIQTQGLMFGPHANKYQQMTQGCGHFNPTAFESAVQYPITPESPTASHSSNMMFEQYVLANHAFQPPSRLVHTSLHEHPHVGKYVSANYTVTETRSVSQSISTTTTHSLLPVNYKSLSEFASLFIYDVWFDNQVEADDSVHQDKFACFLLHVLSRAHISEAVVISSLYYIQSLKNKCPHTPQALGSEYPLFIACLSIANKCLDDNAYLNSVWSKLTRMPLDTINQVERDVLDTLAYKTHLSPEEYHQWKQYLDFA